MSRLVRTIGILAFTAMLTACGSGASADHDLSPVAAEGRDLVRTKGCAACHGSSGDGGVGPEFTGLFGSEVLLQGGETIIADRAYLTESITDPSASIVEGYNLPMPTNSLSEDEVDAVIAYIEALAEVQP